MLPLFHHPVHSSFFLRPFVCLPLSFVCPSNFQFLSFVLCSRLVWTPRDGRATGEWVVPPRPPAHSALAIGPFGHPIQTFPALRRLSDRSQPISHRVLCICPFARPQSGTGGLGRFSQSLPGVRRRFRFPFRLIAGRRPEATLPSLPLFFSQRTPFRRISRRSRSVTKQQSAS